MSIPEAVGTAIGTGQLNTTAIITACPDAGIPARLADDFTFGGFADWFLPSKDELTALLQPGNDDGGFRLYGEYWSSSEISAYLAWIVTFGGENDGPQGGHKEFRSAARAVRAF